MIEEELINLFPFIVGIAVVILALVLSYILYWKPRVDLPLQGERLIGEVSMWLPRGFGVLEGAMTTGRTTMERHWTDLIQNEGDENLRKIWSDNRDFVLQYARVFAIKSGAEKKILLFDVNPEDQKFMDVDKEGVFHLHGVQDARSVGEWDGFEYIGLKLNPETQAFSELETKAMTTALLNVKFLRDAATNKEKEHHLEERLDDKTRAHELTLKDLAETNSKLDRCQNALARHPLTQAKELKVKGDIKETVKSLFWSTPWQLATALIGYFIAPHLITWLKLELYPPEITYFTAFITALGFFIIPIGKKLLGRWL